MPAAIGLYGRAGADSFQISLNSQLGIYFAVNQPDYKLDVVKVDMPVSVAPTETEQFTINFGTDSTE